MSTPHPSARPTALPFLGVLRFAGPDAATFLQGQVTNDTALLADGRTQLAACSTPQGRVVALPRLRQHGEAVYALLPRDVLEPLAARLARFVLRAKVKIEVARELAVATGGRDPVAADDPRFVRFDYAPGRPVFAGPAGAVEQLAGPSGGGTDPGAVESDWWLADISDGLPQVFAAAAEAFVPQMLNLDLLGAISFSKGCYTGQEIVARTQYLGRIKRRLFRFGVAAGAAPPPLAGLHRDGQKAGEVLLSAHRGPAVELLAVTGTESGGVPLTLEDGRQARPLPLPYEVPAIS